LQRLLSRMFYVISSLQCGICFEIRLVESKNTLSQKPVRKNIHVFPSTKSV
jgi:hypothetical protein